MFDSLTEVYHKMMTAVGQEEKNTVAFWDDVLNISKCLIAIFEEFLDCAGIPRVVRDMPHLEHLIDQNVLRGQSNQSLVDSLNECGKFLVSNIDTRMSGAIILKKPHLLDWSLFYFTIGKLWLKLKKRKADLDRN